MYSIIFLWCLAPNLALGQTPEEVRLTNELNQWKQKNIDKTKEIDSVSLDYDGLCFWYDYNAKNEQSFTNDFYKRKKKSTDTFRAKYIDPEASKLENTQKQYNNIHDFFIDKYARIDLGRRFSIFTKPYSQIDQNEVKTIESILDSYIELNFYDEYRAEFDDFDQYYKIYLSAINVLNQPYDSLRIEECRVHTKSIYYRHKKADPTLTISEEQFKDIDTQDIKLSRYHKGYQLLKNMIQSINNNTELAQARINEDAEACRGIIGSLIGRNANNEADFKRYIDIIPYLRSMYAMYWEELNSTPLLAKTTAEAYILSCTDPSVDENIRSLQAQIDEQKSTYDKKCTDLESLKIRHNDLYADFNKESFLRDRRLELMSVWYEEKNQNKERIWLSEQIRNTQNQINELNQTITICKDIMEEAAINTQTKYQDELNPQFSVIESKRLESIKEECLLYSGYGGIDEFIDRIDKAIYCKNVYTNAVNQLNSKFDSENVTMCIETIGQAIMLITENQRQEFEDLLAKLEKYEEGVKVLKDYFTAINADRNGNSYYDTFQFEVRNRILSNQFKERIDTYVTPIPYLNSGFEDFVNTMKQNAQYHPNFEKEILSYAGATE